MKSLGDLRTKPADRHAGAAKPSSRRLPISISLALLATLSFALPAAAASDDSPFAPMSRSFRYSDYHELRSELQSESFSHRNVEERSIAAPTKFRMKSILRYSTPLGDTGLVLRISAPLKLRKLVKLQIRF